MASTSTGYAKSLISKEQPSSSGQVMTWSSGCTLNIQAGAVFKNTGSVQIKSGSTMDVESGGYFTVASGGKSANENVSQPTKLSTALPDEGVSYITTGGNYYLKPRLGARKTIISLTTEIVSILAGTSLAACRFGTSKETCVGITNKKFSKGMGMSIELIGIGATTWLLLSPSSAALGGVASASSSLAT